MLQLLTIRICLLDYINVLFTETKINQHSSVSGCILLKLMFHSTDRQERSGEHMADAGDTIHHQPGARWAVWHQVTGSCLCSQESAFHCLCFQRVGQTTSCLLWRWCLNTPVCPSTKEPLRQTTCTSRAAKGMKTASVVVKILYHEHRWRVR